MPEPTTLAFLAFTATSAITQGLSANDRRKDALAKIKSVENDLRQVPKVQDTTSGDLQDSVIRSRNDRSNTSLVSGLGQPQVRVGTPTLLLGPGGRR